MSVPRALLWLAVGSLMLPFAGHPQTESVEGNASGYRGLSVARPLFRVHCGTIAFPCDEVAASLYVYGVRTVDLGVEVGYLNASRADPPGTPTQTEGLNVSLISRKAIGQTVDVYGRLGTIYSRSSTAPNREILGTGSSGFGLSYGAGVSWEVSPQTTATIGWDSHDFRLTPGRGGEMVRSTSLGLQWRY